MSNRRNKKVNKTEEPKVNLVPKNKGQENYIRTMVENIVTICDGPAGSGKSFCCLGLAAEYLLAGKVTKIVVARPTVEASPKGLGFLKGSLEEKLNPYVYPAIEHLKKFLGTMRYRDYYSAGMITFEAWEYMRGRTYDNSFMILEEAQNCTLEQLKMFITRIGENSRIVINGDAEQSDLIKKNSEYQTDLEYLVSKIEKKQIKNFGVQKMNDNDIVRNPIISDFLQIF
mgnify:CR=1 FL=1